MRPSDSLDRVLEIGQVFTPKAWADFAIERFGLFDRWMKGATVLDPTMGEAALLSALVSHGLVKGYRVEELPIHALFGVELNELVFSRAMENLRQLCGSTLKEGNFIHGDVLFTESRQHDILFGNPPWSNFSDLPATYKEKLKTEFVRHDLVKNGKDVLLGRSRVDIAALIIKKTLAMDLREVGEAVFFAPLSILFNEGASESFRNYRVNGIEFCVEEVVDLTNTGVFPEVSTRHGLLRIRRDCPQTFPVNVHSWDGTGWLTSKGEPVHDKSAPWSVTDETSTGPFRIPERIHIGQSALPRQGINTCGANAIFFFDKWEERPDGLCAVMRDGEEVLLPSSVVHPLLCKENFRNEDHTPRKWVLLPYSRTGRPLEWAEIERLPKLKEYLLANADVLRSRKGTLLSAWMKRGYWWALLGIGPYCFAPFKVVWEAYGRSKYLPILFDGSWQVNQSLQAYMPFQDGSEARRVLSQLQNPEVEAYLHSTGTTGTMGWAQPGKIKRLLEVHQEGADLFSEVR